MGSGPSHHATHAIHPSSTFSGLPLLYMGSGSVICGQRKRAREAYRSHSTPRSSTPGRYRTSRPPPANPESTRRCTRTLLPSSRCSIGRGAPGLGACLRTVAMFSA